MQSYLLLFSAAFLAATILPFSSEVTLIALAKAGNSPVALIVAAATGNTLGAALNWCLGRFLLRFKDRRWFYFDTKNVDRAQAWFQRWGVWSLFFSWLPAIGDALTFVAGVMNVRLWLFLILVGTGKTARYIVLMYLAHWQFN